LLHPSAVLSACSSTPPNINEAWMMMRMSPPRRRHLQAIRLIRLALHLLQYL
jgi:hypothetical protein